jgi:hypothetical protein
MEPSDDLLRQLSDEFQNWIDKLGSVTTGWGDIISAGNGYLRLVMFPIHEEGDIAPDLVFTHPYRSAEAAHATLQSRETAKPTFLERVAAKLGVE